MEKEENQKRKERFMERVKWGQWYMPWATFAWKLGKKLRRPEIGIVALKDEDNHIVSHKMKDEMIMKYMKKAWGERSKGIRDIPTDLSWKAPPQELADTILNKRISVEELKVAIGRLKYNKAPGSDKIPNEIWKWWPEADLEGLVEEFEACRLSNNFPENWKDSDIKWLYKKGDPMLMENYRPIALGNTAYKLFMRIMTNRLEEFVETTGVVSEEQQGFRTDRSCAAAIIMLKTMIARRHKAKTPFYMACLDISKAYDSVDHQSLWEICERMGIRGTWLDNVRELYTDGRIRAVGTEGMLC